MAEVSTPVTVPHSRSASSGPTSMGETRRLGDPGPVPSTQATSSSVERGQPGQVGGQVAGGQQDPVAAGAGRRGSSSPASRSARRRRVDEPADPADASGQGHGTRPSAGAPVGTGRLPGAPPGPSSSRAARLGRRTAARPAGDGSGPHRR